MSNLKRRLDKLEATHSSKWFAWIFVRKDESDDEAIRRTAEEHGLRPEDIGYALFWHFQDEWPPRPTERVDFGGHAGVETLRGYFRFEDLLRRVLDRRAEEARSRSTVS
jgi:hypothetical protein